VAVLWNCGGKFSAGSPHVASRATSQHSPTTRPPSAGARRDGSSAVSDRALRISAQFPEKVKKNIVARFDFIW
jgi:hypothetical protein